MPALSRNDLWSLEEYAERRAVFRSRVIEHKKQRQLALGDHARLYFEDQMTIRYQVQEMLRIERLFEAAAIEEELAAYNPLIPDGNNWKATFMLEFPDPEERQQRLTQMLGIEDKVWLQVEDFEQVFAIADEDLDRANDKKTSSVHFLRFELTPSMVQAVQHGADVGAGIDHPAYPIDYLRLPPAVRQSLSGDLNPLSIN